MAFHDWSKPRISQPRYGIKIDDGLAQHDKSGLRGPESHVRARIDKDGIMSRSEI